jgi:thiosulfate/3-mercaptopyruvate sulfurtransferase
MPGKETMKSSRKLLSCFVPGLLLLALCAVIAWPLFAGEIPPDPQIPSKQLISPEELNRILNTQKPLLLSIGPRSLYDQARIPGAEFIGGTSTPEGVNTLRERVKSEPKNKLIVLYCGCCPWSHCPNVHPAYKELRNLGYTNVRVLYIAHNLGADWVNKGYPTTKG